jgi:methionyl aminopeptidase
MNLFHISWLFLLCLPHIKKVKDVQQVKNDKEIALMRQAGLLTWQAHQTAAEIIRPGVTTAEIDAAVEQCILEHEAIPLFKGIVQNATPFPTSTCISVNEQVVHGIPGSRRLKEGDIVSIDIGVKLNGWCGDAAVTWPVGKIDANKQHLLDVTEGALRLAIELIPKRRYWSQVAKEMEMYVQNAGFSVVEGLVGHSIGRDMWEGLYLPNYYSRRYEASGDFELQPGLVVAIEPMVNMGHKAVKLLSDHWTIITQDGASSAHFEHTIAITKKGPQILTSGPQGQGWATTSAH